MTDQQPTPDYSTTVNLPKTDFPQKANLPEREPERLARWQALGVDRALAERRGRAHFVFHDGPPYANGDIHIGHTLNKVLKDTIRRYKTMTGHRVHYVHGSDCHGLPIEQKVVEKLRADKTYADKSPLEIRRLCAEYAAGWVKTQRAQFERLGVGGDWDNQYVTMDPRYEVGVLSALKALVEKGYVYKGLKVVFWDPIFETALAEAEIEYNDSHISPSIYVKFPIKSKPPLPELAGASIVIWTTTPWTLPANLGVSVHPEFDYVALRANGETLVVARGLLDQFRKDVGIEGGEVIAEFKGAILDRQVCAHPLIAGKDSLVMLGEHVTLEQGTGAVHTAPGHGVDDFQIGKVYGLEVFNPVDEKGAFTAQYPDMEGTNVFKANPLVIEKLRESGLLLGAKDYKHSYPYSWRSRKPVIMRATEQWFMAIDKDGLRELAVAECDRVKWIPDWGYDRIINMLKSRPDWCLSRQRSWGTPIPSIIDRRTGEGILDTKLIEKFMGYVAKEGTDCWYERPLTDFLPAERLADAQHYDKEFNTFDVWFDSGSSHLAVLTENYGLTWPADLYLEGADQHRGWFQHSLWVALGVKGSAPFRAVLTHGFVLDEQKRPMSKSLGNVINPLDIIKQNGADVLRLWVSSQDYRGDVSISKGSMNQMSDAYRRIRNTLRYALSNLFDFDPAKDRVAPAQMAEDDRWALAKLNDLIRRVTEAYEKYEFHRVYHLVFGFCVTELGSIYLDVIKDRLYCSAPSDPVRRSSQTVLFEIASAIARLMAPVIPFTADEVWENLPGGAGQCVHASDFPTASPEWDDAALTAKFDRLLILRDEVTRRIEPLRAKENKIIGNSLDARVILRSGDPETLTFLEGHQTILRQLFIVSQVTVLNEGGAVTEQELSNAGLLVSVEVGKAGGSKCPRCWNWTTDGGTDANHPELCARCAGALRRIP